MRNNFTLTYILLVVVQMLLNNYFHLTPYLMLSILPAMVLCLPTRLNDFYAMLVAFATGLAVDFFTEGTLGINALALVPVALLRRPVIELICGSEPFEQKESISVKKYGTARMSFAILIVSVVFLAIYICADCAGTRPFWFIAARLGMSAVCSCLISLLTVNLLTDENRR